MQIIRRNSDNLVMYAGADLTAGEISSLGAGWCDSRVSMASATVITVASLPAGYIDDCWTYSAGVWTAVASKQSEIDVILNTPTTAVPNLLAQDITTMSFLSTDGSVGCTLFIAWSAVLSATSYEIRFKKTSESVWSSITVMATPNASLYGTYINALTPGEDYLFGVRAATQWGVSAWSADVPKTTATQLSKLDGIEEGANLSKSLTISASRAVFTFTDGVLDAGNTDITLTAIKENHTETVTWTSSPNLVSGTGNSKTLSAATFAANKSVLITGTTPSGFTYTVVIVRLDKSTAAANATSDIALLTNAYCVAVGNKASKIISDSTWDGDCYSRNSFTGGCYCEFRVDAVGYVMAGLNEGVPASDSGMYDVLSYAWYMAGGGTLQIYQDGGLVYGGMTYVIGDVLSISYDGSFVRYRKNGVLMVPAIAVAANRQFFFDSSFYSVGMSISEIKFVPLSSNNWSSLGGIPARYGAPTGSGLFFDDTHFGYYASGAWKAYMDNTGSIRGAHFMTHPGNTGKRIEIYGADYVDPTLANEIHVYGDVGGGGGIQDVAAIGLSTATGTATIAVFGTQNTNTSIIGVLGQSYNNIGVVGRSINNTGIEGFSVNGDGVLGSSEHASQAGVKGTHGGAGKGVSGYSNSGRGIYGESSSGHSGYFTGGLGVYISGTCEATSFKGPLDGNATNATYGRYVYNNGTYGGTIGYIEASALCVYYSNYTRYVYYDGAYGGSAGYVEPSTLSVAYASSSGSCASASNATNLNNQAASYYLNVANFTAGRLPAARTAVGARVHLGATYNQTPAAYTTGIVMATNAAPASTSGISFLSVTVTPVAASGDLEISGDIYGGLGQNAATFIVALFEGSTLLGTWSLYITTGGSVNTLSFKKKVSNTSILARTFVVRVGTNASGLRVNSADGTNGTSQGGTIISGVSVDHILT